MSLQSSWLGRENPFLTLFWSMIDDQAAMNTAAWRLWCISISKTYIWHRLICIQLVYVTPDGMMFIKPEIQLTGVWDVTFAGYRHQSLIIIGCTRIFVFIGLFWCDWLWICSVNRASIKTTTFKKFRSNWSVTYTHTPLEMASRDTIFSRLVQSSSNATAQDVIDLVSGSSLSVNDILAL